MTPSGRVFPLVGCGRPEILARARAHRVWAEVDLNRFRANFRLVAREAGPGAGIMAVLKAGGYGHGAVPAARVCQEEGALGIGVGDVEEALELREAGITLPVLVLGAAIPAEIETAVRAGVSLCVHSPDLPAMLNRTAGRVGSRLGVHLKVDTGMTRLGVRPAQALEVARDIAARPRLRLEGVFTHLSSADDRDTAFTRLQLDRFRGVLQNLEHAGLRPPLAHAANSAALWAYPNARFDMARAGLLLFGVQRSAPAATCRTKNMFDGSGAPSPAAHGEPPAVLAVMSVRTQVAALRSVGAGTPLGYGRTEHAHSATLIATLPVGYNDGYRVGLSRRAQVLVRGCPARVVGRVCMDYTLVDVGHIPGVRVGDVATLIGRDGNREITAGDLARILNTVPYEVFCGLGSRVKRVYIGAAAEVAA